MLSLHSLKREVEKVRAQVEARSCTCNEGGAVIVFNVWREPGDERKHREQVDNGSTPCPVPGHAIEVEIVDLSMDLSRADEPEESRTVLPPVAVAEGRAADAVLPMTMTYRVRPALALNAAEAPGATQTTQDEGTGQPDAVRAPPPVSEWDTYTANARAEADAERARLSALAAQRAVEVSDLRAQVASLRRELRAENPGPPPGWLGRPQLPAIGGTIGPAPQLGLALECAGCGHAAAIHREYRTGGSGCQNVTRAAGSCRCTAFRPPRATMEMR